MVTSATAATADMAEFLVSFVRLSRSYVRTCAAPVVPVTRTLKAVLDVPLSFVA